MTLEQAMEASPINSAFRHPSSGGIVIVDGSATRRFGYYDEDNYWVQEQFRIVRKHYSSLDNVKKVVSANHSDWQPGQPGKEE